MALNDTLANALTIIRNAEKAAKRECYIHPSSKLILNVLEVLQKEGFIEDLEYIDDKKGGVIKVKLNGNINDIKAVKPRFSVKVEEIEKYEKRFIPSRDIGLLILTTPQGVMTHKEAKEKGIGGKILAYVY